VLDDAGKLTKLVGVCQDITDRKAAEAEVLRLNENLERRVEELRAFEREYRTRLRQHHEAALKDLDHRGTEGATAAPAAPTAPAAGGVPTAPPAQAAPPAPPAAPPAPPTPGLAPQGAPVTQAPPAPQGQPASPFAVPGESTPPHQG